ncbi:ferredoxin [Nanobdella aerobiophila]|uniref:Ferredoxin n=1 Tax=Nanobdella aerobiophila TaxID=2586965 RepID=A0A915SD16_9ARCH|nr:ferredoxin [Nanobdella aerobiophila]BBL45853.1 ferredoxin [Nanobdella aerobiophila]
MRVRVDKNTCIGCGTCIAIAPEIFDFDKDGKSINKIEEIEDEKLIEEARDSKIACPTGSIFLDE